MKIKIIAVIVVSFISINGFTQTKKVAKKNKGSFKLRQSFQSEDTKPEPAVITYTKPKGKEESFLIDAALGYTFPASSYRTVSAYSEYHKNTLADTESNTLQIGMAYEWFSNKTFLSDNNPENLNTTIVKANSEYSNDMLKKIESFQISGEITRLWSRKQDSKAFLPNIFNELGSFLAIEYFPSVGIEWESRIKAENDSAKGSIGRVTGKIYTSIYPFWKLTKKRIELFVNGAFRYDAINTTLYPDRTHPTIEAGVNFILSSKKPKISIGFSYNSIDDPGAGKVGQSFLLVALKAKL